MVTVIMSCTMEIVKLFTTVLDGGFGAGFTGLLIGTSAGVASGVMLVLTLRDGFSHRACAVLPRPRYPGYVEMGGLPMMGSPTKGGSRSKPVRVAPSDGSPSTKAKPSAGGLLPPLVVMVKLNWILPVETRLGQTISPC